MIPGVQIKLRLQPAESYWPLISQKGQSGKFRLHLEKIKLLAKTIEVEQSLVPKIMSALDSGRLARYPFIRTSVTGMKFHFFSNLHLYSNMDFFLAPKLVHDIPSGTISKELPGKRAS